MRFDSVRPVHVGVTTRGHRAVPQIQVGGLAYNPSSGQTDLTLKPNKTQRRKHQINSLAFEVRHARGRGCASRRTTDTCMRLPSFTACSICAGQAAERELELMERKGQAMKTRAQTQSKYGW